jgi:hypothetical protein
MMTTELPPGTVVSLSSTIVRISFVLFVPDTTADAGELGLPEATFTVQVVAASLVAVNTSTSDERTMMFPDTSALDEVNATDKLKGVCPMRPNSTEALDHITAVNADVSFDIDVVGLFAPVK